MIIGIISYFLLLATDHCVQSGGGQQQSITDQEMKQLLVNIHDMMKQIVASQQTNTVLASALPASDSYGNPLASTSSLPSSSNRAPDSYGVAQAAPISGASPSASSSSRPTSNAPDSYGVAKASPISGSTKSSSAPSSYSAAVSSSSPGVSSDEPVILSTYQQINSALRRYRDTLQHNQQEEDAGNLVNIVFRSDRISSVYIVSKWVVGCWLVTLFLNLFILSVVVL